MRAALVFQTSVWGISWPLGRCTRECCHEYAESDFAKTGFAHPQAHQRQAAEDQVAENDCARSAEDRAGGKNPEHKAVREIDRALWSRHCLAGFFRRDR